jgi:hypothetical protein
MRRSDTRKFPEGALKYAVADDVDQRIVRALSSFITRSGEYSLARLEFAIEHPELPAPPVLERLPDASEQTLRDRWEALERQLDDIMAFLRSLDDAEGRIPRTDATFAWLARIIRELDQYGRALRWVLTVTERDQS